MTRVAYDGAQVAYATGVICHPQVAYATGGLNVPHGGLVGEAAAAFTNTHISYFAFCGEKYSYFGEN